MLVWILIQLIAGLSLFPAESAPLFKTCTLFGAFLMGVVGLIAVLQMTISATDQGPLLAGLAVYAAILFVKALIHFSSTGFKEYDNNCYRHGDLVDGLP